MEVIELHHKFFMDFGFEFHSSQLLFYKDFPQGQQIIFVHYTESPTATYLEYHLGIRIDEVEEIIHKFLPSLNNYSERSITLVQTPNKIGKMIPKRFEIKNDGQLAEAIMAAEKFFVLHGFPWLDEMIQPDHLESEFANAKDRSFKTQNFVYNSFRGATLAKMYSEKDYPILRDFYLKQIKKMEMTPFTIALFLQLLNYLDHIKA